MEPQSGNRNLLVTLLAIVLSAAIAGGLVYAIQNKQNTDTKNDLQAQVDSLKSQLTTVQRGVAIATTYTNTKYGYSFDYPAAGFQLSASSGNADNLAISATADGVNVYPTGGTVSNGIFYVSAPGIELTMAAIKSQFGSTKAENIAVTSLTIGGSSGYKVTISGDTSVVSSFYFVKNKVGTVLKLTAVNSSTDAQAMLNSFQIAQ